VSQTCPTVERGDRAGVVLVVKELPCQVRCRRQALSASSRGFKRRRPCPTEYRLLTGIGANRLRWSQARRVQGSHVLTDTGYVFIPSHSRALSLPADTSTARHVLRSRLLPLRTHIPNAWLGAQLEPGVTGFMLGGRMMLAVRPPGRNIWSSRKSPVVFGRLVRRADGGCDLRLALYRQGFPYRAVEDPSAEAFFDDWVATVAGELGASPVT
jgi:hypothetical protein